MLDIQVFGNDTVLLPLLCIPFHSAMARLVWRVCVRFIAGRRYPECEFIWISSDDDDDDSERRSGVGDA